MHVVQTITAIHDRYLSASPARETAAEVYHWSRAASLFNQKLSTLSMPLQPPDRDALWATAALLSVIAFSMINASTPEEAWPLNGHSDLEWLRMCGGKNIIWKIAGPLRYNSVFHTVVDELRAMVNPTSCGIEGLPSPFIKLYDLGDSSTAENNPYHTAVHSLAPLLHIECSQATTPRFFSFISHIKPEFRMLLERKDSRALLLLAYWYAKICHSQWWIARRALLECQSICLYLERHYAGETAIQDLLLIPKIQCELVP